MEAVPGYFEVLFFVFSCESRGVVSRYLSEVSALMVWGDGDGDGG